MNASQLTVIRKIFSSYLNILENLDLNILDLFNYLNILENSSYLNILEKFIYRRNSSNACFIALFQEAYISSYLFLLTSSKWSKNFEFTTKSITLTKHQWP